MHLEALPSPASHRPTCGATGSLRRRFILLLQILPAYQIQRPFLYNWFQMGVAFALCKKGVGLLHLEPGPHCLTSPENERILDSSADSHGKPLQHLLV